MQLAQAKTQEEQFRTLHCPGEQVPGSGITIFTIFSDQRREAERD
jgi:hypothetical protein